MLVDRNTPIAQIKKIYRSLSKNLHPDKNKSETAADEFRIVAHAFDVLTDKEKRREYDRLGDAGVSALVQSVVDHKYIVSHMIVHYVSSLVFAFLLNMSEKGGAFGIACAGLTALFLLELCLKIYEWPLPSWFFPQHTPFEVISTLHQIFSPAMHGVRCVLAVLNVDRKAIRESVLESLAKSTTDLAVRMETIVFRVNDYLDSKLLSSPFVEEKSVDITEESNSGKEEDGTRKESSTIDGGISFVSPLSFADVNDSMENMLHFTRKMVSKNKAKELQVVAEVQDRLEKSLVARHSSKKDYSGWILLRNLLIYVAARFVFVKSS